MIMVGWIPQQEGLMTLLQLLREAHHAGANNQLHRQVEERLNAFQSLPDYNNYLAYILVYLTQEDERVRTMAGLLLKNNIRLYYPQLALEVKAYVKECCLEALGTQQVMVRNTIGSIISTLISRGTLHEWPQLIQRLGQLADPSTEYSILEGAMGALFKICEESAEELNSDELERPLNQLIPKWIRLVDSPHEKIRVHALGSINQFILLKPSALMENMPNFIQSLYHRANDPCSEVRKRVCQGLVMLMDIRPEDLMPQIQPIVEYMIHCFTDSDSSVALEAGEFWLTFAQQPESYDILFPFLPKLVPILVKNMIYSEQDLMGMKDIEDAAIPDRAEDIKPRFHKAKTHGQEHNEQEIPKKMIKVPLEEGVRVDNEDEEEEEEEEDDEEDTYSEWSLRKCSAASLDMLATIFSDDLLPFLLPILRQQLFSEQWEHRECGILALGAVAEGCDKGLAPHLSELVPYLIAQSRDLKPLIRTIACWSLTRYSAWICEQADSKLFFEPTLYELLHRCLDTNKRVQEAACSAFATFEEEAGESLVPYLEPILRTLVTAFGCYQQKNLLILYDAIGTLADSVGNALNREDYIALIMPPLIEKWNQIGDDDRDLFPVLECLSSVASGLGTGFQTFAAPVFDRCIRLIQHTLHMLMAFQQNPDMEEPDKDFIVVALDLLSGMSEGLGHGLEALIAQNSMIVLPLLLQTAKDSSLEVRQSAFALLGDLAIGCFPHLQPFLHQFILEAGANLDPSHISVCNNAVWALGEIAIQYGASMKPYVTPILQSLIKIMQNAKHTPRMLIENVAITIGRFGLVCPEDVAPHLPLFLENWCRSVRNIRDNLEKDSAFRGLCEMVKLNPSGVVNDFLWLSEAIASWHRPPADLAEMFRQILHGFKNSMGTSWSQYFASFSNNLRTKLTSRYGI